MNRRDSAGFQIILTVFLGLSTASVCVAGVRIPFQRYPSPGVDCQRDVTLSECALYVNWVRNNLATEGGVGEADTVESRALPADVTDILQNPSLAPPQNSALPTEITDAQKAAQVQAAEEYATATSATERAAILETIGLTNDQLMKIAADASSGDSSYTPVDGTNTVDWNVGSSGNANGNTGGAPIPNSNGGSQQGASATTSTNSNRSALTSGSNATNGLYIPRGSEIGLSEISVTRLIQNLLNWLLYIVGFIAIIAFVIAGIQYLMAGADTKMAEKGKANMTYAMIGVLVALSALIIVRAIQAILSGALNF